MIDVHVYLDIVSPPIGLQCSLTEPPQVEGLGLPPSYVPSPSLTPTELESSGAAADVIDLDGNDDQHDDEVSFPDQEFQILRS